MRKFVSLGSLRDFIIGFDEDKKYYCAYFPRPPVKSDEEEIEIIRGKDGSPGMVMQTDPRFKVIGWTTALFAMVHYFGDLWSLCKESGATLSEDLSKLKVSGNERLVIYDSEKMLISCTQYGLAAEI